MSDSTLSSDSIPGKVLVVGAGSIGLRHARLWGELEGVQVGICDSSQDFLDAARQQLGAVESWSNFQKSLEWKPEVVVVAVPHALHPDFTCAAMEAGADVLCEKPMSMDAAESQRMAAVAAGTGRLLRVGFVNRFHPGLVRLKSLWKSGALGEVLYTRYSVGSYETLVNSRSRYQSTLPGALVMDYVHGIDLILWLSGKVPSGVYARGVVGGQFELSSSPNLCEALFDYESDLLAGMQLDYAVGPLRHTIDAVGDTATVTVDLIHGAFTTRHRTEDRVIEEQTPFERDDLFRDQIRDFLRARSGSPSSGCSPEEGIQSTSVMQSVLASLVSKERVSISSPQS